MNINRKSTMSMMLALTLTIPLAYGSATSTTKTTSSRVSLLNPQRSLNTELLQAAWKDDAEVVKALLEAKADVNATVGSSGVTSLQRAVDNNNRTMIEALLEAGAEQGALNEYGYTPVDNLNGHLKDALGDIMDPLKGRMTPDQRKESARKYFTTKHQPVLLLLDGFLNYSIDLSIARFHEHLATHLPLLLLRQTVIEYVKGNLSLTQEQIEKWLESY